MWAVVEFVVIVAEGVPLLFYLQDWWGGFCGGIRGSRWGGWEGELRIEEGGYGGEFGEGSFEYGQHCYCY